MGRSLVSGLEHWREVHGGVRLLRIHSRLSLVPGIGVFIAQESSTPIVSALKDSLSCTLPLTT